MSGDFEQVYADHSQAFVALSLAGLGFNSLKEVANVRQLPASALRPTIIGDMLHLTEAEKLQIADAYHSVFGVSYFILRNPPTSRTPKHPLFDLARQLGEVVPVANPLRHPMEGHYEAVSRFGPADGTVKVYDLPGKGGAAGYREQAETNEAFEMHHDGLGSGGTVQSVLLYMDSRPLFGGFTYFQNILLLGLLLAKEDAEAFKSLFLPDALTILRPRGKGAIKVVTPVLFVNDADQPQSFFRVASGEYQVLWRDNPALARARTFLEYFAKPFSSNSSFVCLSGQGHGCLVNNQVVAHGRTAFVNDSESRLIRVLSRKWFMRSARDATYKHVPGVFISSRFASAYSDVSSPELLTGEWLYDDSNDVNCRER